MFDTIIGHDGEIEYLKKMVSVRESPDGFPSTLLFHGPSGVGKRTLAETFAKKLNCQSLDSCRDDCPSCMSVGRGDHSDVSVFEPENRSLKIDKIRGLLKEAKKGRLSNKWKVFIIDDAHLITPEGADALLKTTEDGNEYMLFILVTDRRGEMVRTLVSRSINFSFGPLSEQDLKEVLKEDESHEKFDTAIKLARGSVERALYFLEGDGFEARKKALGFIKGLSRGIPEHKTIEFLDGIDTDPWRFVEVVYNIVLDVMKVKHDVDDIVNDDQLDILEGIEYYVEEDDLFDARDILEKMINRRHIPVQEDRLLKSTFLDFQEHIQ